MSEADNEPKILGSADIAKTEATIKPAQLTQPTVKTQPITGGGEKTVAKDPKGMFDYSDCKTYQVAKDDKLIDIAFKYHIALQQLRYFNHIDKATLKIKEGQTIYIPNEPVNVPVGK